MRGVDSFPKEWTVSQNPSNSLEKQAKPAFRVMDDHGCLFATSGARPTQLSEIVMDPSKTIGETMGAAAAFALFPFAVHFRINGFPESGQFLKTLQKPLENIVKSAFRGVDS